MPTHSVSPALVTSLATQLPQPDSASHCPRYQPGSTKDSTIDLFVDSTDFKVRHKQEEQPSVEVISRKYNGRFG
jgi:hypothetical protein